MHGRLVIETDGGHDNSCRTHRCHICTGRGRERGRKSRESSNRSSSSEDINGLLVYGCAATLWVCSMLCGTTHSQGVPEFCCCSVSGCFSGNVMLVVLVHQQGLGCCRALVRSGEPRKAGIPEDSRRGTSWRETNRRRSRGWKNVSLGHDRIDDSDG